MAETSGNKSIDITKSPEDIPRADLIHLCLKMKKRMEQLTSKEIESTKRRGYDFIFYDCIYDFVALLVALLLTISYLVCCLMSEEY